MTIRYDQITHRLKLLNNEEHHRVTELYQTRSRWGDNKKPCKHLKLQCSLSSQYTRVTTVQTRCKIRAWTDSQKADQLNQQQK